MATETPSDQTLPNLLPDRIVSVDSLKPHPRNYKKHPPGQLKHLAQSLRQMGQYRNVVVSNDGYLLAGHGVWEAARDVLGWPELTVKELDEPHDSPTALKLLALDNEVPNIAETDDRALTELLREIRDQAPDGLLGTGIDDQMLAALVYVTRSADEIGSMDEALQWVGLPAFGNQNGRADSTGIKLHLQFDTEEAREEACTKLGLKTMRKHEVGPGGVWSSWYPERPVNDRGAVLFDG